VNDLTLREQFIVLVDNDIVLPSDAIIFLEGDGYNRIDKVVRLYNEKLAPVIVFTGGIYKPEYGSLNEEYILPKLKERGIPDSAIISEQKSQNTREQAEEVMKLTKERSWRRIILVASNFHQYRAYLTFLKGMQDANLSLLIFNASAKLEWFTETGWGKRFDLMQDEFRKIDEYKKNEHIASFEFAIEYQKHKEEWITKK
jgi:uncharacterized SAM-binding protein YcdF (DUF218 family)